jgi:DNA topoisomerase I
MKLVIVESPAKSKTINKYLGKDYNVVASFGHIRDLPSKDGSVRPDEDFAMTYEISDKSIKHVKAISDAVKQADTIYLATDPDREGEAISWHIIEALKERKSLKKNTAVKRIVFHEITKKAVLEAINQPRDIDMDLVNAQQARRALDYLVGFTLSPVLWRKLPGSKSAGRVQSVALRLICDREEEIERFVSREYWDIKVQLATPANANVTAMLTHVEGKKLDKFDLPNEAAATAVAAALRAKQYAVSNVEKKQVSRNPYAPFTTSSLQQEASRKLGMSTKTTMQVAQKLYEGVDLGGETVGLITYMRTDGVTVSADAVHATRALIGKQFGEQYVPKSPRMYKTKAKNAQEAHEAIRPTNIDYTPEKVRAFLDNDQLRLYELIWKRMVASQMENVVMNQVSVTIDTHDKYASLRATGSTIHFDGFYVLYREGKDDEEEDENKILPPMNVGDALALQNVNPAQHFTEPLPRYGEASLVKKMEELGIGRPSTYSAIISVLQEREYVKLDKKRFVPEERGRLVTTFLVNFFSKYVEYGFTAHLEDELDNISAGEINWKKVLSDFWNDFNATIHEVKERDFGEILEILNQALEHHIFPPTEDGKDPRACPSCGTGKLSLRLGKFGGFIACSSYPDCNYKRQVTDAGGADQEEGGDEPRMLGIDKASGQDVTVRKGPYGYYIQMGEAVKGSKEKPKRMAIPAGISPADVTMEQAVALLSLPREVGVHPESGKSVTAGLGRFGPYLLHDGKYTSLPKDDDILTIGINRAVTVLAESKTKAKSKTEPLRVIGAHPEDGKDVAILDGRYGVYINHNKLNATLPKTLDIASVTMEQALELLAAQAEKKGTKAPAKKKAAASKKTAKEA